MTYEQVSLAIDRIITTDDCTTAQKTELGVVKTNIQKMAPYIQASSDVVEKFMMIAGYITAH